MQKLSEIKNVKHKAILSLIYSVGLLNSELINMRIEDIDSHRMIIHIRNSKGRKDRYVPLSDYMLKLLRYYYKIHQPKLFLFNGQGERLRYSKTSVRNIMHRYISKEHRVHDLRHSMATFLIDQDTALPKVSKLLGHNSTRTTEIYTHLSKKSMESINLPT